MREESERHGLAAMDALHVAAAHLGEAEVLYTFERNEKPMHRTTLVQVVSLHPADQAAEPGLADSAEQP
jgi:predicted nucleic acid-binding protein